MLSLCGLQRTKFCRSVHFFFLRNYTTHLFEPDYHLLYNLSHWTHLRSSSTLPPGGRRQASSRGRLISSRSRFLPPLRCSFKIKRCSINYRKWESRGDAQTLPRQPSWMSPPGGSTVVNLGSSLTTKSLKFLEAWVPNTSNTCLFIRANLQGQSRTEFRGRL